MLIETGISGPSPGGAESAIWTKSRTRGVDLGLEGGAGDYAVVADALLAQLLSAFFGIPVAEILSGHGLAGGCASRQGNPR